MSKFVSITAARTLKDEQEKDTEYRSRIMSMDKLALLNELIAYQEERTSEGTLTPSLMVRGKILFTALEAAAETDALLSLMSAYRRHLEYETQAYLAGEKSAEDSDDLDIESM